MAAVFGGNEPRASLTRDLGNVRIVDPATLSYPLLRQKSGTLPGLRLEVVGSRNA